MAKRGSWHVAKKRTPEFSLILPIKRLPALNSQLVTQSQYLPQQGPSWRHSHSTAQHSAAQHSSVFASFCLKRSRPQNPLSTQKPDVTWRRQGCKSRKAQCMVWEQCCQGDRRCGGAGLVIQRTERMETASETPALLTSWMDDSGKEWQKLCTGNFYCDWYVTLCRTVVTICTAQWSLYVPHIGHYMYRTVVTICTAQWSLYVL